MIQIIGAGAIGCLWLAKLQLAGNACHLVSRSKPALSNLLFTDLSGQQTQLPISLSQQVLDDTVAQKHSTILVCVKAQHVVAALLAQQRYIQANQPLILMHNGYGCAEQVRNFFPDNPIICATTANASLVNNKLDITQTGSGPSYLGVYPEQGGTSAIPSLSASLLKLTIEPLQQAMPAVYWSEDIEKKCWLKLAINAVINPLTAIHQISNGELQAVQYRSIIQVLIVEIFSIADAEHIDLTLATLQQNVEQVMIATANNYSSMNRDIFYHRQTEIEFINGYLIKKAQQHNVAAPLLTELYNKVKALENHSLAVEDKY